MHEYGSHVGGVPRSSWEGGKLCNIGKGSKPKKTEKNNTKQKPKKNKTKPAPEDPNNQCGQSFALYYGETCET